VAALREQLRERLGKSRTNDFSDAWRLALEELELWDLTGNRLLERIEEIFRRHEITPSKQLRRSRQSTLKFKAPMPP
jgi:hypothetical protein